MRLTSACLAAATLLLLGCRRAGEGEAASGAATVVAAGTAVAASQAFPLSVRAIGTVTPRPGGYAELAAPAPTRVARVLVAPGDHVAQGDTLVEFERAPFDAAAKSADAALTSARHAYARAVRLGSGMPTRAKATASQTVAVVRPIAPAPSCMRAICAHL